ncbi:reverse transcriptase domain-containing protein [Shewanella oncorhynchi]|uniref:RNA-directed DNA polymerase n=1 Tax=Shewanella oncorhynchi TaxID=2726434 RepID=UPI003D7BD9DD
MAAKDLWGNEGILGFPIDCNAVLMHLKQDMRDDWFFDSICYKDLFSKLDDLKDILCSLVLEDNGIYTGNTRTMHDIPKKGLGIRYALETDFYDRFIYQAICSFLIKFYDPLLSYRVLSHRYNKHRANEKYIFKNRIELWKTFEGITFTFLKDEKALLATDLINYFENISLQRVKESFERLIPEIKANGKEKLQIRNAIATLCALLEKWSYSDKHGLPQNRDASSFIANVILNEVDYNMTKMGYDYYRYVDDIRIICDSQQQARKALNDLIKELRTVNMNINSAKTKILIPDTPSSEICSFFPNYDDRSEKVDTMWKSRSRRVIARSIPLICSLIRDCIEKGESQSRQFRFAVNRLSMLAEADIFDIQSELSSKLVEIMLTTLSEQPASTDQYCRLLSILNLTSDNIKKLESFLADDSIAIHSWQNYHLWFLLARKKYSSEILSAVAKERIRKNPESAEAAAIFIFLHCTETSASMSQFMDIFSAKWPYQNKRHFLFAAKDIETKLLLPEISTKTRATISRAIPYFSSDGTPISQKEKHSFFELFDNISEYE